MPLPAEVTGGQRPESTQFERVLEAVRVPRAGGPTPEPAEERGGGQGVQLRPHPAVAGAAAHRRGVPQRKDQKARPRGRPGKFHEAMDRCRTVVERCVGWLKKCWVAATRFEKLARHYLGMVKLAMSSDTCVYSIRRTEPSHREAGI